MEVHFWDMDGTIVDGDVDTSWKTFLIDKGIAPAEATVTTEFYYEQYCRGELDQIAFGRFQHAEFAGRTYAEMASLAHEHFEQSIRSCLYQRAVDWVKQQQSRSLHLALLTATSRELSEPVAAHLNITNILATNLEQIGGRYTGEVSGVYCGGSGKVEYILPYLESRGAKINEAYYYGDSMADVPVFEAVGHPVVCNPGDALRQIATERDWPVHDFASETQQNPSQTAR